jgi:hypothetical protein
MTVNKLVQYKRFSDDFPFLLLFLTIAANFDTIPKSYLAKYSEDIHPAATQKDGWR